jgi:phytoene dehydrogenase-like protein
MVQYEELLCRIRTVIQPLLDAPPPELSEKVAVREQLDNVSTIGKLLYQAYQNKDIMPAFYELFTGPAETILNRYFESDIVRTTLATDAVVGALVSPRQVGSAYVLLHHVMGEADGRQGVWAYVQGGMGAVSEAIASSARAAGAEIRVNAPVQGIVYDETKTKAVGVRLADGSVVAADIVISGCTPFHAIQELSSDLATHDIATAPSGSKAADIAAFAKHVKHTGSNTSTYLT